MPTNSDDAIRKVLKPDMRLSELCRHVSGKTGKSPVRRAAKEAPRTRKPKLPTYAAAKGELLEQFRKERWSTSPNLKTPHATSEDGEIRFWFKPQAVWVSRGKHTLASARSTGVDMRQPGAFEKLVLTYTMPAPRTKSPATRKTSVAPKNPRRFTLRTWGKKEPWHYSSEDRDVAIKVAKGFKAEGWTTTVRDNETGENIFEWKRPGASTSVSSAGFAKELPSSKLPAYGKDNPGPFARNLLRDIKHLGPRVPMSKAFELYTRRMIGGGAHARNILDYENVLVQSSKRGEIELVSTPNEIFIVNPYAGR